MEYTNTIRNATVIWIDEFSRPPVTVTFFPHITMTACAIAEPIAYTYPMGSDSGSNASMQMREAPTMTVVNPTMPFTVNLSLKISGERNITRAGPQ